MSKIKEYYHNIIEKVMRSPNINDAAVRQILYNHGWKDQHTTDAAMQGYYSFAKGSFELRYHVRYERYALFFGDIIEGLYCNPMTKKEVLSVIEKTNFR